MHKNKFSAPQTLKELSKALKTKKENCFIAAGGTDLAVKINKNRIFDYSIIDITKIQELEKIEMINNSIIIGACTTMQSIENSEILKVYAPALVKAASKVGSTQIRNRATIGGNIANASQSADTLTVLMTYNAEVEIINSQGKIVTNKVNDIVKGLEKNLLNQDEVITKIKFKVEDNELSSFSKVGARKAVTISKINCCIKIKINKSNLIEKAEVYFGAIGPKPIKSEIVENVLVGKKFSKEVLSVLLDKSSLQVNEAIPTRASRYYKRIAVKGLVDSILNDLIEQEQSLEGDLYE